MTSRTSVTIWIFFQFWFRDVLMFKATREVDNLVFKQEINYIREQASQRSYENLEKILDALEKTKSTSSCQCKYRTCS